MSSRVTGFSNSLLLSVTLEDGNVGVADVSSLEWADSVSVEEDAQSNTVNYVSRGFLCMLKASQEWLSFPLL